ncbi:MAG TPA: permease-like cell division protein FtsX [bacterium]|jgi:cell division transport system permease protein
MRSRHNDRLPTIAGALAYFGAEAVSGVRRNGLMSVAAITTVMVVLLSVGASILIGVNLANIAGALEADVQIVAFLRDGQSPDAVALLQRRVREISGVAAVRFVSRAEALNRLRQSFGDDGALANLDANPLPDSLEIRVLDPQQLGAVAGAVRGLPGVDDVTYGAQVVDRLLALTRGVRILMVSAGILLGAVAVVVVVNTIRLTVIARRQEIEIMGLVGATRWFIRWPFLIEGMLHGVAAAGASAVLLSGGYALTVARLGASLPFLPLLPVQHVVGVLIAALVLVGVGVGGAGSAIAVRRFLAG